MAVYVISFALRLIMPKPLSSNCLRWKNIFGDENQKSNKTYLAVTPKLTACLINSTVTLFICRRAWILLLPARNSEWREKCNSNKYESNQTKLNLDFLLKLTLRLNSFRSISFKRVKLKIWRPVPDQFALYFS